MASIREKPEAQSSDPDLDPNPSKVEGPLNPDFWFSSFSGFNASPGGIQLPFDRAPPFELLSFFKPETHLRIQGD